MKRLSILIIILLSVTKLSSQSLLLNYGNNYSMINDLENNYVKFDPHISYQFGIGFKKNIIGNLDYTIHTDFNKISSYLSIISSSASHFSSYDYNLKLNYLSFKVLPRYSFGKAKWFFIELGPYFSYLVSSYRNGKYIMEMYPLQTFIDENRKGSANEDFKRTDYGFIGNIGFRIALNERVYISPQFGYKYGIHDIEKGYFNNLQYHPIKIRAAYFNIEFEYKLK